MIMNIAHKQKLSLFEKNLIRMFLEEDHIIAFPTDTVYGFGVHGKSKPAINKIYALKHRTFDKALILLGSSREKISPYIACPEQLNHPVLKKFWPGALTVVFGIEAEQNMNVVHSTQLSLGVRVPKHPLMLDLLEYLPFPLLTTSANISNEEPLDNAQAIENSFNSTGKEQIACILDEGTLKGTSSTVIRIGPDGNITLLRQGAIQLPHATLS